MRPQLGGADEFRAGFDRNAGDATGERSRAMMRGTRSALDLRTPPRINPSLGVGRVAQRESTPFTREGSQVRSLSRPPLNAAFISTRLLANVFHREVRCRTARKHAPSMRGKYVEFVHQLFCLPSGATPRVFGLNSNQRNDLASVRKWSDHNGRR
jgi:hypothetical protein